MSTATSMTAAALAQNVQAVASTGLDTEALERVVTALGDAISAEAASTLASADGLTAGLRVRVVDPARVLAVHATLGPADYTGAAWRRQHASLSKLFARSGEVWLRVEARRSLPGAVDVTGELLAAVPIDEALVFLGSTDLDATTRERVDGLVRGLGDTCIRIVDALKAPSLHTRTLWIRTGPDVAERARALGEALQIVPAQLVAMLGHLAEARPIALGVCMTPKKVLSEVHVASWAGPGVARRLLGIDVGAGPAIVEAVYHAEAKPFGNAWATNAAEPAVAVDPRAQLDLAAASARIGTAASSVGLDAKPLLTSLSQIAGALDARIRVTMPADASRLAVRVRWPDDPQGRAAVEGWLRPLGASDIGAAMAARGHASVEVDTAGAVWLHAEGERKAGAGDLELAGIAAPQVERALAALGNATHGASRHAGVAAGRVHVRIPSETAVAPILAAGEMLGIHARQRGLVGDIHRLLAKRPEVVVSPSVGPDGDELWVTYFDVPWETAVRVVVPVLPGRDPGKSLGHLAGATGARDVASLILVLRRQDPLRVLVAVDLRAGAAR